ncbi:MAG: fumarylacetoacetate hydrolase family protein [Victivallales bacterium]|nr:fumarylacetoacetate hydrolase family protein [Victivallales bacterium]MCF7888664.1 fumarylacetoacetate hydrolase family protein [Victivallales bacterium]
MKLIRFGNPGKEKPGIITGDGKRIDCSSVFHDWDNSFFNKSGLEKVKDMNFEGLPEVPDRERWGAPVPRPGKILCIGLNYHAHAKETGAVLPKEPMLFMKGTNAAAGPYDNIIIPKNSRRTDYEVELGVVIGKDCRYLDSVEQAPNYIAGYVISNDVSEREFQKDHSGQFCKGKSCDNFNPIGPFLATADEISDSCSLNMTLKVNGEVRQNSNTSDMIFKPDFIVYYLSQFMTLEAGDLISTGTPSGVALGMEEDGYLKPGDIVELQIEKLGKQKSVCIDYSQI